MNREEELRSSPEVDTKQKEKGKWIDRRDCGFGEHEFECSKCHKTYMRSSAYEMKYCMNCGAEMSLADEKTGDDGNTDKQKIKTKFAIIVVTGTKENPYYSIAYLDEDNSITIGWSSYNLEFVYKWLNEEFDIDVCDIEFSQIPHGMWGNSFGDLTDKPFYRCSVCKNRPLKRYIYGKGGMSYYEEYLSDFCPYCGAKMDGDDYGETEVDREV